MLCTLGETMVNVGSFVFHEEEWQYNVPIILAMASGTNNIDFKAILEYYMYEGVMHLDKEQLHAEIMDLLAIVEFLERKIPLKIKTVNNRIQDYLNDLNKVKLAINQITCSQGDGKDRQRPMPIPSLDYFCNVDLAYHNYSQLTEFSRADTENQLDIDYENVGLREMELKYLESVGIQKYNRTRGAAFKNIDNRLHLIHKKYLAVMGLKVEQDQYVWNLEQIRDTFIRKSQPHHREYFNTVVMEDLRKTHKSYDDHVLAAVFQFLSFVDLRNFQESLLRYPFIKDQANENIFFLETEEGKLKLEFSSPTKKEEPYLRLTYMLERPLELTIYWKESYVQGELAYSDLGLKLRQALDNMTPGELLDMMFELAEIGKVYDKLKGKQEAHIVNLMKDFMYWKVGNYHWYYEQWNESQINHMEDFNGIYLTNVADEEPVLIRITENVSFQSKCASHAFISELIKGLSDLKVLFIYLDLVRTLSQGNKAEGCQLDDFRVADRYVWMDFRQKIVYEDLIIKTIRGDLPDDKSQFTSMSCMVQFDLRFRSINMFVTHTSHPPKNPTPYPIDTHCSDRWRSYIRQHKPEERLSLHQVKLHLDSVRKHFLIKRIYERRLQENNRALFQLSF